MIDQVANQKGFLDITFSPFWDFVPFTRNYIYEIASKYMHCDRKNNKIVLTVSELLENAVKYSEKPGVRLCIRNFSCVPLEISVYNYANKSHSEHLFRALDEMKEADPMKYYIQKLKESVQAKPGHANIGLARIKYEAGPKLKANFIDKELLEVSATFTFEEDK
jgi:hypothetical protein